MSLDHILTRITDTVQEGQATPEDYINLENGLKYCGKCHTPKEAFFPEGMRFGERDRHPILCQCAAEERERQEAQQREFERRNHIAQLRSNAFWDIPTAAWRFENATLTPPACQGPPICREVGRVSGGRHCLLLFGDVGTGKSYAAGCIANLLIDQQVSVAFVPMSDVVNRMQGSFGTDRDNYMKRLMRPDLLMLDDLGAERNTSFGKERVFDVVNRRLLTGKPMIVTTNIPLTAMKNAVDLDDRRIYDRLRQVCMPIQFSGVSFRKGLAAENMGRAAELLND